MSMQCRTCVPSRFDLLNADLHWKATDGTGTSTICRFQYKCRFQYNLSLLEDRDAELERYDQKTAVLTAAVANKEQQLLELQQLHAEATFGEPV